MKEEKQILQSTLVDLNERAKELNCLYEVDEILRNYTSQVSEVFYQLTRVIPNGWQHNEICRALIKYDDKEYSLEEFKKTELKQKSAFECCGKHGELSVYYIKPVKQEHRTIFLNEEQKLLNTIAHKLQQHLEYRYMKELISQNNQPVSNRNYPGITDSEKEYLKSLFLNEEQIEMITKVRLSFRKGETICKQGALTNHIFLLTGGLSKAYLESPHDSNFIFKIIKPYDFIGLSSLFGENTYQFTVSALQNCSVYLVEKELFQNVFFQNQPFAKNIMKWYCTNYEKLLSKISDVSSKQSLGRIADVLLYLSEFVFVSTTIEGCISRKEIAEMAGLSTESAVRILSDMKADNIIRTNKSEIEILNIKVLKNLSLSV
ncbi:MAG: hypothetical protein CVU05_05735 [Bacteroidetes bacterium HGW-Bacteroidetes-21]|nr:MAG: hypothetical protein CVU05_05735 [Bacteroidetes bacterium HGW-Bacteroidetes-21]